MKRETALDILNEMITNAGLKAHCLSVGYVCEAYARQHGESEDDFFIAGVLHDADYEKFPDEHPKIIVGQLTNLGESK